MKDPVWVWVWVCDSVLLGVAPVDIVCVLVAVVEAVLEGLDVCVLVIVLEEVVEAVLDCVLELVTV